MRYHEIKQLARKLCQSMTDEEIFMWRILRNRRFKGKKFNRQYPIIYENRNNELFFFIADFYCHEHKLVLEIDGKIHNYQKEHDEKRDSIMKEKGLNVLRIKNEEFDNLKKIYEKIESFF